MDVCWRLQERGGTSGFSPAAVVWHHRRNSVRAYWKQQQGYGKAEALLAQKWPRNTTLPARVLVRPSLWHGRPSRARAEVAEYPGHLGQRALPIDLRAGS